MGQGYYIFPSIFFVTSGFVPDWLKHILLQEFILVATVSVKDCINVLVREEYTF